MSKKLVIVESPAKSKTLNKFLGKDYSVAASMGHVADLPKTKMGVDVENNFKAHYITIPKKRKVVKELKGKAKDHESVYLAADPDREGESICWHLKNELSNGKPIYRVSFNEITKNVVQKAFENPHEINMDKVNAQQARRILDRLVGYSLSPLLWKKVTKGLSAGRVQSVAVRLIVEREEEIDKFEPEEYWDIEVELGKKEKISEKFKAKLFRIKDEKPELSNEKEVNEIKKDLKNANFKIDDIKKSKRRSYPKPPFTTSTLQQVAYNCYKFTSKRTMRVAQQLYEGVELENGEVTGLITYMRTDSVRISKEATNAVRKFIETKYGKKYLPKSPKKYKSKKGAQEAHEAIRPTYVKKSPEDIKEYLTKDQYKLYKIIWKQFVGSQMKPAVFDKKEIFITANKYLFKAIGSILKFEGYYKVLSSQKGKENLLPKIEESEVLKLIEVLPNQHFTKPAPRYSEASLIKTLEKKGVGRPSTYAPTISTILSRDYVRRLKGSLIPTDLGKVVTELLIEHFPKILDIKFTANMEKSLDLVEEGEKEKEEVLKEFYGPFSKNLEQAKVEMENIKKKTIPTSKKCKKCGSTMVIKWGRWGKFLSCSQFPDCKYSEPISTGIGCPQEDCNGELVKRRSKKGKLFFGCSNYPECKYTTNKLPEE